MPEEYKYDALFDPVKLRIAYIWKSLHKIIERKYNDFIIKNPDYLNRTTIPFLKIQFCRREKMNWEQPMDIYKPVIKKHETTFVKTVKETEKQSRNKRSLITKVNQSTPLSDNDDEHDVREMMKELMNFDTKVRTYDVIERQIFYEEVEETTLPVDVLFLDVEEDFTNNSYNCKKTACEQSWST